MVLFLSGLLWASPLKGNLTASRKAPKVYFRNIRRKINEDEKV